MEKFVEIKNLSQSVNQVLTKMVELKSTNADYFTQADQKELTQAMTAIHGVLGVLLILQARLEDRAMAQRLRNTKNGQPNFMAQLKDSPKVKTKISNS